MSLGPPDLSQYRSGMPRWERKTVRVASWRVAVTFHRQRLVDVAWAFSPGSPSWRWWHLFLGVQLGYRVWLFWRFREKRPTATDFLKYTERPS